METLVHSAPFTGYVYPNETIIPDVYKRQGQHRGEAMGDHQRGPAAHQFLQRGLHQRLALGVQRGCRLIQQQKRRVAQDGPCDRDPLALAAGKRDAALAELGFESVRQDVYKRQMLFTIEIMKERLTSSGLSPLTLAFTSCRRMPCIASRSATPNASAISWSPISGSGWSMANPCDRNFIRGAAAAFVGSVAVIVVGMGSGAAFMSGFPEVTGAASARSGTGYVR